MLAKLYSDKVVVLDAGRIIEEGEYRIDWLRDIVLHLTSP